MEFLTATGKKKRVKKSKDYKIDWDGPTRSKFQSAAKEFLRPFWQHDDVYEEFPIVGTRMTLDLYNHSKGIAVEVSGRQHYEYVKHFHGKSKMNFLAQLKRDQEKLDFCTRNGIILVEVASHDEICLEFFVKNGAI